MTENSRNYPTFDRFLIGGSWVEPVGAGRLDVISPSTEDVISSVPDPTVADMDRAVAAAVACDELGEWRRTEPVERAAGIRRIADGIEARTAELAQVFAGEIGCPVQGGLQFHQMSVAILREFARLCEQTPFEERRDNGNVRIRLEPVGVVAGIIPWNGPVAAAAMKLGPALAAGCSIVLKPAPEGPLTTYILAEIIEQAELPAGLVSILPGGREVGEHLVKHPQVAKIAFTGSTAAGRRIMSLAGERVARISLELGGKSAAIIGMDVDPADTLPTLLPAGIGHSGQVCAAITRVIIPRHRENEWVEAFAAAAQSVEVGDPFDEKTAIGPLAMERQRDRVEGYLALAREEGAITAAGGTRPIGLDKGWYIQPTVLAGVNNAMRVAQEEIFGPVVCLIPYDTEDEAIAIANDSEYGLSGAVYSHSDELVERVVREVRTGQIFINSAGICVTQPFGGFKQSGLGREGGSEGLSAYLETKTVQYS